MKTQMRPKSTSRLRHLALFFALAIGGSAALAPSMVHAQQDSAKAGDSGWEAVNGQMGMGGESFQAKDLVGIAYGFIWVMVAGFVVSVWRRTQSVEREVVALRERIESASKTSA